MNSKYNVAVIGGGVIGVCSAYYLAQKGLKIILIEKGEIASGCSSGNAGLIVPSHAMPLASPGVLGDRLRWLLDAESPFYIKPRFELALFNWLVRFVRASRQKVMLRSLPILRNLLFASAALYDDLADTAGFYFGYEGDGSLWVCLSEERLERERHEVQLLERSKIPARIVTRSEVHDLEPALLPEVVGGVFYPNDGHIDPQHFVVGLAEKARQLGVEICTQTEVLGFEASKRKITCIQTTSGNVHAEQIVLAAGVWSTEMARALNLRLPIQAAKGYSITLKNPPSPPKLPLLFGEARVAVNPLGYALRLAGTLEMAGMDLSINKRRVETIRKSSSAYLAGIEDAKVIETWCGLRPCTPDGLPIISQSKNFRNLIIAAGHAMLGMSLGPITGKLVSQLACQEKTDQDLSLLREERY
ncbi:MAG TPA: FAD-dependent oxidoreductase [Anaerolineales bacterium]|nr:FAD-dependent oxidoreductase [Anaerolineales bacterium]